MKVKTIEELYKDVEFEATEISTFVEIIKVVRTSKKIKSAEIDASIKKIMKEKLKYEN